LSERHHSGIWRTCRAAALARRRIGGRICRLFLLGLCVLLPTAARGDSPEEPRRGAAFPHSPDASSDFVLPYALDTRTDRPLSAPEKLELEIQQHVARTGQLRDLLGERRLMEAWEADFDYQIERGFVPQLQLDSIERQDQLADAVRGCVVKLWRERLVRHLFPHSRFLERRAAREANRTPRLVRISPRLGLGSRRYVGAKLHFASPDVPALSHFKVGLRQHVNRDEFQIDLEFEDRKRSIHLRHVFGDRERGDRTIAAVRYMF
jgi:hypothetical protein